jgi:hypothetical protein
MPLQATSGAASYDAFGGGVAAVPAYIEEIFGTFLYTGNSSTQTITNGIDLAGEGGLVWIKNRSGSGELNHILCDSARGYGRRLSTNNTDAQVDQSAFGFMPAFTSSGFSFASGGAFTINESGVPFASWTFRKQPKFFDVVTYTGNNTAYRSIAHSLGVVPGLIIIKAIGVDSSWMVWHKDLAAGNALELNSTAGANSSFIWFGTQTATHFQTGNTANNINDGTTYVAYLFAHNAGGFGLTGTDNVISCGSYTGNGSLTAGPQIDLGYEPQWLMVKRANSNGAWLMMDAMRGFPVSGAFSSLQAQTSGAEGVFSNGPSPTATGFVVNSNQSDMNQSGSTYIYIAIRRGPMKVPTTGTSVFAPLVINAATGTSYTTGFPIDSQWTQNRNASTAAVIDRLRFASTTASSGGFVLGPAGTSAEINLASARNWGSTGGQIPSGYENQDRIFWNFRRAPGFFDEVCYTGDAGFLVNYAHNLTVRPELVISKRRDSTNNWAVAVRIGNNSWVTSDVTGGFVLNSTASTVRVAGYDAFITPTHFGPAFIGGGAESSNISGATYVAYLFATCPGVSKVGSYTGNGTTQAIACGFTGGARFVLIKRTDAAGDWYVYDTARGMTVLTNPYLWMNSGNAEVATLGSVTTTTGGFTVNAAILAAINTNAASYIFLAIA